MELQHKHGDTFCMKHYLHASNYKHGEVRNSDAVSDKFNIAEICIRENYTHKWIIKLYIINL